MQKGFFEVLEDKVKNREFVRANENLNLQEAAKKIKASATTGSSPWAGLQCPIGHFYKTFSILQAKYLALV